MGVDHGLEGKNGVKSRERREKRAKKVKAIAMKAITGGKKREIVFDEKARLEYLTGFGKRKQERRKYGLAMEVLKKQKAHRTMVRENRVAYNEKQKTVAEKDGDDGDESDSETESNNVEDKNKASTVFKDDATMSMFGSEVSIEVDTGIMGNEQSDDSGDEEKSEQGDRASVVGLERRKPRELTKLERALKIAKTQMGKKKQHRDNSAKGVAHSKKIKKVVESKKLLSKATGKKSRKYGKK